MKKNTLEKSSTMSRGGPSNARLGTKGNLTSRQVSLWKLKNEALVRENNNMITWKDRGTILMIQDMRVIHQSWPDGNMSNNPGCSHCC